MNEATNLALVEDRPAPGAPSKFREEYCEAVIEHMADGASLTTFAAAIGVSRRTLTVWQGAHPDFADAVDLAKAKALAWWEERARDIAQGNGGPGASAIVTFGLKNLGPEDWQDKQQHEHVGNVLHRAMSHEEAIAEAQRRGLPTSVLEE